MTSEALAALKRMVKERTNIEEARNALYQLLRRGEIDADEVMEFVDAYKQHTKVSQPVDLPASIRCYIGVKYEDIRQAIRGGYDYRPMTTGPYSDQYYDEVFEVEIPLSGLKQLKAAAAKQTKGKQEK